MPLRKLATKIFDLSALILGLCFNGYFNHREQGLPFSTHVVKVCSLLYNLLYWFSYVLIFTELQSFKKNGVVAINETPQGSANGTVCSVADCQYCTNSSGCYLKVNDSTPVFTPYSINMLN
jgi:hypothetical protein